MHKQGLLHFHLRLHRLSFRHLSYSPPRAERGMDRILPRRPALLRNLQIACPGGVAQWKAVCPECDIGILERVSLLARVVRLPIEHEVGFGTPVAKNNLCAPSVLKFSGPAC